MNITSHVNSRSFRSLMAGFPTGIAVISTTDTDGRPWGMTCSSVCAVSVEPPTLLVCVRDGSPTLDAMVRRGAFAVNLLHGGARPTAELFASGAPDRFNRVRWQHDAQRGGPHLVEDAHTVADCRISQRHHVGDHTVVFGEVFQVTDHCDPHPLLYGMRQYAAWPTG
ncbi:flavin reductase family protein [Streptomyces sp. NBC_00878]|uniref:flavin reductase family protein n=1 Tax=Streptomyces sp. NBC_00878 TaxID=2975854 RepID=UPI00224F77C8|nr:flavin reductase family protein [Streptomyces sp. NBC_00878]MCX4904522.1 flavin reductase family protein [Streptomyces sp. NBC_00878]